MSPRTIRCALAAAVALSALALAGCAPAAGPDGDRPPGPVVAVTPSTVAAIPTLDELRDAGLPLAAYIATNQQRVLVDRAYARLLNQCLERVGHPRRVTEPAAGSLPKQPPVTWRYGVSDPAVARQFGYLLPPRYRPATTDQRERMAAQYAADPMSGAEQEAHDSCQREATRDLGTTDQRGYLDDVLAQSLRLVSFDLSRADDRVVTVITAWSACMAEADYLASDPEQAQTRFDISRQTPTDAEIPMAVVDVECKRQTNLVETWYAVEAAYQEALIQANADALEAGRRSVDHAVRVATTVAAGRF